MTRRRRFLLYTGAGVTLLLVIAAVSLAFVLRSDWFHDRVRLQIVEEIERASGGRAKIGAFHFDWKTQTADLQNFTLHGGEASGEAPLFQAADVRIGLKIVSALKRNVDIASLIVDHPKLHLIVYPDGSTNLPGSNLRARLMEQALNLHVGHFELRNGVAQVNERRFPLDVRGDRLIAILDFDHGLKRYVGRASSRQVHISAPGIESTAALDFDAELGIGKDRIQVSGARFATPKSWIELTGAVRDLRVPQGDFEVNASLSIAEAGNFVALPVDHQGQANFRGKLTFLFGGELSYDLAGRVTARDLAWRSRDVRVSGVSIAAEMRLTPNELVAPEFTARALGGDFHGRARIERFERFRIEVDANRLALEELSRLQNLQPLPWSGFASGPIEIAGAVNRTEAEVSSARAQLRIEGSAPNPVTGDVAVAYDGRARTIEVAKASLQTHATRAELSGVLGRTMYASLETSDLNDLTPALLMIDSSAPKEPLVRLSRGVAKITGEIGGALDNPQFSGRVDLPAFTMEGRAFDRLTAEIEVNRAHIVVRSFALDQEAMRLTGSGSADLQNWRPVESSPITASVFVKDADIARVLAQNRRAFPASGTASAHLALQGTYGTPQGDISVQVDRPAVWGQQFDQLRVSARLSGNELNVSPADLRLGQTHLQATGVYRRTGAAWDNGSLQFHITSKAAPLDQIKNIRTLDYGLAGRVTLEATGTADVRNGEFELTTLNGDAVAQGLALKTAPLGSGKLTARMRGATLELQVTGDLRGAQVRGSGQWQLSGDEPGRAEVQFSPVSLAVLHDLAYPADSKAPLPFQGFVDGAVTIAGPLRKLDAITAQVTLNHFEMSANPDQKFRAGVRAQDLVVQNVEPLRFQITRNALTIQSAKFAAKDTKIDAAGRITFNDKSPWDVSVRGGVNMAILQLLSSDLLVQGNAVLDATVHGPIRDPEVNGRLELRNASLNLSDLPTGVDNANGVISFDRNRATIQKLTAQVGGGRVAFGGFVGFGGGVLLYRVQATADQVRLRNSTGATGTFNAALNLTGSSENALVSGNVTVLRAGFAPGTDLGGLLAASARPLPAPASPNEYLRTINFDVRIESGPSLEFETALTHDIEAEAELRLRGNAARPVLLGNISVTAGDIVVYGNKYEINRGDIRFLNPVRIEPTIDIDLQTKARGIIVGLSFTGTLSRLNLTYRSDPPLQTSDIVALLAVGRDPMTSAGLASTQTAQSNLFTAEANTITQAISAPSSNRLQRFFGVSRLKIDPQMLGVENTPQARLSVEQQVSRNITVTYVTTLSFTQEQIFRVEWDLNKQWSAVATREENGIFGIDFVYKKRFR